MISSLDFQTSNDFNLRSFPWRFYKVVAGLLTAWSCSFIAPDTCFILCRRLPVFRFWLRRESCKIYTKRTELMNIKISFKLADRFQENHWARLFAQPGSDFQNKLWYKIANGYLWKEKGSYFKMHGIRWQSRSTMRTVFYAKRAAWWQSNLVTRARRISVTVQRKGKLDEN